MVGLLKRLFAAPQPQPFAVVDGGQRIVDPLITLNGTRIYAGLRREDRLALYHSLYYSMPIATSGVNVLTKLVNTRPIFKSGNAAVDRRCAEIWQEINGHQVNDSLIRQSLMYGYSVGEIVYPTMQR